MIQIDNRTGSVELYHMFPSGVPIEVARLEFGDFAFVGCGEGGPTFIGIERKSVRDLLNSISTGRLSGHQLIGLFDAYSWVYIVVEGAWRFNPTSGILEDRRGMGWAAVEVGSRRFMAREMMGYLNTLAVKTGAIVLYSNSKTDTVQQIVALYHWWQKPWADHVSHLARNKVARETSLVRPGLVRRMAAELPLVGWGKSKSVEERFSTVVEMVNATEEEWRAIPGVGKKMSKEIYLQLRGGIYDKRKI